MVTAERAVVLLPHVLRNWIEMCLLYTSISFASFLRKENKSGAINNVIIILQVKLSYIFMYFIIKVWPIEVQALQVIEISHSALYMGLRKILPFPVKVI
jgi:hypothetical protein